MKKQYMVDMVEVGQKVYGLCKYGFTRKGNEFKDTEYIVSRKNKTSFYLKYGEDSEIRANKNGYLQHIMFGVYEFVFLTEEGREEYLQAIREGRKKNEYLEEKLKNLTSADREYLYNYFKSKDEVQE